MADVFAGPVVGTDSFECARGGPWGTWDASVAVALGCPRRAVRNLDTWG